MPQHAPGHLFPGFGRSKALFVKLRHAHRMTAILDIDHASAGDRLAIGIAVEFELEPIELRLAIDHGNPSIN
jgi:hypothetical protein